MKCKKIISMVAILVVVLTTTVFATVGSRTAELVYNNIKVKLNGTDIKPTDSDGNEIEPFIIDGTTYLPVRGVASALGLNVAWDGATNTVVLDNPGIFQGGVQVYDDPYVTLEFVGCRKTDDSWSDKYYADFNIKNKTDTELTFQPGAISFDGISYQLSGSEEVAPQSTGKISFYTYSDILPTGGVSKISGQVTVIDFEHNLFNNSYNAKWVNVTQK